MQMLYFVILLRRGRL